MLWQRYPDKIIAISGSLVMQNRFSMLFQKTYGKGKLNSSAEWSRCLLFSLNHCWWVDFFIQCPCQCSLLKGNGVLFSFSHKFLIYYRKFTANKDIHQFFGKTLILRKLIMKVLKNRLFIYIFKYFFSIDLDSVFWAPCHKDVINKVLYKMVLLISSLKMQNFCIHFQHIH